ncbi:MAG: HAD family hydrolase, partial [Dehalococcoidia bacterium]
MRKLLLFDVDQTILSTRGGDRKALNIAFEELFGIRDGFEEIQFAGRMDLAIVGDAFRMWDVDHAGDPETIARFKDAYFKELEVVLRGWTRGREYPGVRELLGCLSRRKDVDLGL